MQMQPEKGNAPGGRSPEALDVKNQAVKQGFNMSNHTEVTTSRAITVPFHGAELYVVEHNGQPYTPMKPVVSGMGLDWAAQFSKLKANPARWGVAEIAIPTVSGVQSMICLPLRKLFGWLAGINIGKIRESLRERVSVFQNECDDVLWQYWNDGAAVNPRAFSVQHDQTLSEEQAATLRNLLTRSVKRLPQSKQAAAMIKGWSKLKAHFKTDYRHIPAHEFHEAVNILARHIAEWEVVDEAPRLSQDDASRLDLAFSLATEAAAQVQRAVFSGVMTGNDDWQRSRYLLNLQAGSRGAAISAHAKQIEGNACVLPIDRFHSVIEDSITVDAQTLTRLASVCMARLGQMAHRMQHETPRQLTAA